MHTLLFTAQAHASQRFFCSLAHASGLQPVRRRCSPLRWHPAGLPSHRGHALPRWHCRARAAVRQGPAGPLGRSRGRAGRPVKLQLLRLVGRHRGPRDRGGRQEDVLGGGDLFGRVGAHFPQQLHRHPQRSAALDRCAGGHACSSGRDRGPARGRRDRCALRE